MHSSDGWNCRGMSAVKNAKGFAETA